MRFLEPFVGWIVAYWLAVAIVHVFFAIAVFRDAQRQQSPVGRGTILVVPGLWSLATLVGGVVVAGIYWLIHHSTLRPPAGTSSGDT